MLNDLTGNKFGRLTVLRRDLEKRRPTKWICRCECGAEKSIYSSFLTRGRTKSCGCYRADLNRQVMAANRAAFTGARKTHGMFDTPTHRSWNAMLQRCTNPNRDNYSFYGGRGITVCDRWFEFENFLADMGVRPAGTSLDRINNDAGYEPGNCRWATRVEQSNNRRKRGPNKNTGKRMATAAASDEILGLIGSGEKTGD